VCLTSEKRSLQGHPSKKGLIFELRDQIIQFPQVVLPLIPIVEIEETQLLFKVMGRVYSLGLISLERTFVLHIGSRRTNHSPSRNSYIIALRIWELHVLLLSLIEGRVPSDLSMEKFACEKDLICSLLAINPILSMLPLNVLLQSTQSINRILGGQIGDLCLVLQLSQLVISMIFNCLPLVCRLEGLWRVRASIDTRLLVFPFLNLWRSFHL